MKTKIYYILEIFLIAIIGCSNPNEPEVLNSKNHEVVYDFLLEFDNSTSSGANQIIKSIDGDYLIAGYVRMNRLNSFIAKMREDGEILWKKTFSSGIGFKTILEDSDKNIIAGGNGINSDFHVINTDANGNLLWEYNHDIEYSRNIVKLAKNKNGEIIIAASSYAIGYDGIVYKLDVNGNLVWEYMIDFGDELRSNPFALFINEINQIEVLGQTGGFEIEPEFWIITLNNEEKKTDSKIFTENIEFLGYLGGNANIIRNERDDIIGCGSNKFVVLDKNGNLITKKEIQPLTNYSYLDINSINNYNNGTFILAGDQTKRWEEKIGPNHYQVHTDPYASIFNIDQSGIINWIIDISSYESVFSLSKSVISNEIGEIISDGYNVLPNRENGKAWIKKIRLK